MAGQQYILLSFMANSKVLTVKEEIQRAIQISPNEQFLTFDGKVLEDQKCLSHYCIHDFSFLKLSLVMRGGGKNAKPQTITNKSTQSTLRKFFGAKEVKTNATSQLPSHQSEKNPNKRNFSPAHTS